MELIHDRLLNNQFAPGIATYGIDGKDGKVGPSGTSFYFTSYSLEDKIQRENAIVKINRNMVLSEFVEADLGRQYAIGDLVLDSVGKIFKIVQKNGQFSLDYVTSVIGIDDNEYFKTSSNNRIFLDANFNGLDVISGTDNNISDLGPSSYALRVTSLKEDSKTGKHNIIQILSKPVIGDEKTLNISYDKNYDSFMLETSSSICLSSDKIEVQASDTTSNSLGDYYKITPYNDPIGLVHMMFSKASWKKTSSNSLTISGIDTTHLESLGRSGGFAKEFTVSIKFKSDGTQVIKDNIEISDSGTLRVDDTKIASLSSSPRDEAIVSIIRGIEVFIAYKNQ